MITVDDVLSLDFVESDAESVYEYTSADSYTGLMYYADDHTVIVCSANGEEYVELPSIKSKESLKLLMDAMTYDTRKALATEQSEGAF